MNYAAPKGWIEVLPRSGEGSQHSTFHLRQDCDRIKAPDQVVDLLAIERSRQVAAGGVPAPRPTADSGWAS